MKLTALILLSALTILPTLIYSQDLITFDDQKWNNDQVLNTNLSIGNYSFSSNNNFYTNYGYNFNINGISLYYIFVNAKSDKITLTSKNNNLLNFISVDVCQVSNSNSANIIFEGWKGSTKLFSKSFSNLSSWQKIDLNYNNIDKIIIRLSSTSSNLTDFNFDNFTIKSTTQESNTSSGNIVIAADNAELSGDVHLTKMSGSKEPNVLYFLNTYSPAKFTINLNKSGQWYAWGRMYFKSSGSPNNSFYLQVDNGPKITFGNNNSSYDKWHWEGDGLANLPLGNLSSGSHTITIYGREAVSSVMLDQILITSDANLIASDNPNQITTNTNNLVLATEDASLSGNVHLTTMSGSIGKKVLYFLNTYSPAKFSINLNKSGQWYAWGRMYFKSSGSPNNSFYLQVDNGPKLTFGNNNNSYDKWHWEGNGLSNLYLGNLNMGSHTITIYGREAVSSVMLDQIVISSDAYFTANDNNFNAATNKNITEIKDSDLKPNEYKLLQNYPNPFNPSTIIQFSVPNEGNVSLKIYNILGAEIATLINESKPAGTYNVTFNASDLSSGVYFYKLVTPNFFEIKKMLLVK